MLICLALIIDAVGNSTGDCAGASKGEHVQGRLICLQHHCNHLLACCLRWLCSFRKFSQFVPCELFRKASVGHYLGQYFCHHSSSWMLSGILIDLTKPSPVFQLVKIRHEHPIRNKADVDFALLHTKLKSISPIILVVLLATS